MAKHFYTISFILLTYVAQSQEVVVDKQRMEAGRIKPDSNFVEYLIEIGDAYSRNITKNDSAEVFLTEAINVAEEIGYNKGLMSVREDLGQHYAQKGKLNQSLNLLLKNEALAIKVGDSTALFNTLRVIAGIYLGTGDVNMAHTTLNRRQFILDNNGIKGLKDTSYYVISQYNSLAQYYNSRQISKEDSATYFYRKMYTSGQNTSQSNLWIQLGGMGLSRSFSLNAMYDSAVYYLTMAMDAALKDKRIDNYYTAVSGLASVYQKSGKTDSAFFYAYKVFSGASKYSYLSLIAYSSSLLASLYTEQHKYDSAVKYMTIDKKFTDSIMGKEKLNSIQTLTNEYQLKQLENKRAREQAVQEYKNTLKTYFFIGGLVLLLGIIGFMYRINNQRSKSKKEIEAAYNELKRTQTQLIQSEKMASLGELTAGIAHEIQNPLNFVNNFSEINNELIDELKNQKSKLKSEEQDELLSDIFQNNEKINHHGKRADAIVKGMLQHSRSSTGQKEPTDINALCDEYLRLAYHGLRAKDKSFNATFETSLDKSIGNINIIPQDIGRVIMNLLTNAFYAVNEKRKSAGVDYEPVISISTKKANDKIEIKIADNGNGIPGNIIDKIFQPFFTTKPTGQGTGLGLSLSYDIVKAHGGEIKIESKESEGSTFIIKLPG